jgi:hypothetical protein
METMSQQAYPEGWWGRVAASLQLSAEQRALLKAAWGKLSADRAALLARHEAMTKQLRDMQQQQALKQQDFGKHLRKASERCFATMAKHAERRFKALLVPSAAAAASDAAAAGQIMPTGMNSTSSSRLNNAASTRGQAPAAGFDSSSCSGGSSSSTTSMASADVCCNTHTTYLAGAMAGTKLEQQQAQRLFKTPTPPPAAAAAAASNVTAIPILSMTCAVQGPIIAAAANAAADSAAGGTAPNSQPDLSPFFAHPEVLLCPPRPGQAPLEAKLSGLRCSLALLYSWGGLVCYNALSRKQLAVAAVTSYPFAFDPVAGESTGQVPTC